MKKTLIKLALPLFLLTCATFVPPRVADAKCATCPELLQACRNFCGTNQVNYSCQNHNPCAGTCSCL